MKKNTPKSERNEPYPLTEEQKKYYRENGYIKLKNVLRAETIDYYRAEISRLVEQKNPLAGKNLEERDTYEKAFIQIVNLWLESELVKEFVLSKRLGQIAADLMQVEGVRLYHDQALYKEPSGNTENFTPWHADQFYWPLQGNNTVTAWIPLQATPLDMGPLAFSKGSQKYEIGRDLAISDESEQIIQQELSDKNLDLDESDFDLGEISFHSGWTFHRAGANKSDEVRATFTIIYMEDGINVSELKYDEHRADRDAFLPELKPGDVAATDKNPLIYRK